MDALDKLVAAQSRHKQAQKAFDCLIESLTELRDAHLEAVEADQAWRQELEEFVRTHGRLILSQDVGPWLRINLRTVLHWSEEQIEELEETFR